MKIIRIATDTEIQQRMLDIASGYIQPSDNDPKVFVRSIDELIKLISKKDVNLLAAIHQQAEE